MTASTDAQPGSFTIFHFLGLLLGLGLAVVSIQAGWQAGGVVGALGGLVVAVVLAPIGAAIGCAASLAAVLLLIFVGSPTPPPGVWIGRLHKATRGLLITGCFAWLAVSLWGLRNAPTWDAWRRNAGLGVLPPLTAIGFLVISWIEARFGERRPAD